VEVVKRIGEHYDVREVEGGLVGAYNKCCPECVVVQCACGKRATHKRADIIRFSVTTCECDEDDMGRIRKKLITELLDEAYEAHHHPWRFWHTFAYARVL
jgi:hypothetical protein